MFGCCIGSRGMGWGVHAQGIVGAPQLAGDEARHEHLRLLRSLLLCLWLLMMRLRLRLCREYRPTNRRRSCSASTSKPALQTTAESGVISDRTVMQGVSLMANGPVDDAAGTAIRPT